MIKKEILITENNLEKQIKKFLKWIKNDYFHFNEEWKTENYKWKELSDNKEVGFIPEKITLRSPMTILNAPWGTGKTHFIEAMGEMILNGKITGKELEHFVGKDFKFKVKNFIIIDVWKIFNYESAVELIYQQVITIIFPLNQESIGENLDKWNKLKDSFFSLPALIKTSIGWSVDSFSIGMQINPQGFADDRQRRKLSRDMSELENSQKDMDKLVEDKLKNDDDIKTLIFFDNVERLGPFAWDVIKIIQKLQELNNLIIVFSMNKNKLINISENKEDVFESHMEKYLNMDYYNLQQDYLGVLKNSKIKEENQSTLNDFFNQEISGKKRTIREMKKIIENRNVIDAFSINKIFGLKSIIEIISKNYSFNEKDNEQMMKYLKSIIIKKFNEFLNIMTKFTLWQNDMFDCFAKTNIDFPNITSENITLEESTKKILVPISFYINKGKANGWKINMIQYCRLDWVNEFKEIDTLLESQLTSCLSLYDKIRKVELEAEDVKKDVEKYKNNIDKNKKKILEIDKLESPSSKQINDKSIALLDIGTTEGLVNKKETSLEEKEKEIEDIKSELLRSSLFFKDIEEEKTKEEFKEEFSKISTEFKSFISHSKTGYLDILKSMNKEDLLIYNFFKNIDDKIKMYEIIDENFINDDNIKHLSDYINKEFRNYSK
ncbi:MAG: hypothetical protein KFW07_04120 [Mycoplasmataceae bacterium]|nr:hypothetical protein [Mycoplasmataceae bacterium]